MSTKALPPLETIAKAVLQSKDGQQLVAEALWASQPMVVLVLRRPGCVLCRDEAQKLWSIKPQLDDLGVGLACIVHEWIPREVDAFASGFWPGPLYLDTSKAFYKALNGGTVLRGNLLGLLWPWSPEWQRITAASKRVKEHNIVGDGFTMGGAMLVRQGTGGVAWTHLESKLGLVAEPEAVLREAQKVVGEAAASTPVSSASATGLQG